MIGQTFSPGERRAHELAIDLLHDQDTSAALASSLAVFPTVASNPILVCGQWNRESIRSPTIAIFPGRTVIHCAGFAVIRTLAYPFMVGGVS